MKIFKAEQVREADAYTIKYEPISSIDLMERAAKKASAWIINKYSNNKKIAVFVGPGNNGGDGLVIARHLLEKRYQVKAFNLEVSENYSEDFLINKERLRKKNKNVFDVYHSNIDLSQFDIIIDAIFGSGLTRPISGGLIQTIKEINQSSSKVIAIDIPSGLFGEDNSKNKREHIVKADYTLTFQFPKLSFLLPENSEFVGEMSIFDIGVHPEYIEKADTDFYLTHKEDIPTAFLNRKQFSHKGTFGHALIFAGSKGKMGAAILASKACLRSGAGLLSALIPKDENLIMQTSLPEIMTFPFSGIEDIPNFDTFTSVGIGPGLGQSKESLAIFSAALEQLNKPSVFDADALNLLAANPELLQKIPKNSIFTPHPKELERLIGQTKDQYSRLLVTQKMAQKYQIYILIKGAYSTIVCPDGTFHFNSTGNTGMATAGCGDVLTGIITGLLSQGLDSFNALRTGVFIHGLAGDIAKKDKGELGLIASDIIDNLGNAFEELGKD